MSTVNDSGSFNQSMSKLLKAAFQVGASDIHIKPGAAPMYRISGELRPVEFPPIDEQMLGTFSAQLMRKNVEELRDVQQIEFSYEWPGVGRFRGNYYLQLGKPALALRTIPPTVPDIKSLRLPAVIKQLSQLSAGLILVTGATGMGKTTSLACIMNLIANTSCRHIITIEDPVEYKIEDGRSCVTQREVGRDVPSYREGLKAALRQDPDVLMIGEARDRETMEVVLHAAQSGHLVLTSAHFSDTTATVNGIIGMTERTEQINWRSRLADTLQAIISQILVPRRERVGRVLATEVLINEPAVRACIMDESRTKGIRACLERGRTDHQTHTIDQCLLELIEAQLITVETARSAAVSPGDLMREINLRRLA